MKTRLYCFITLIVLLCGFAKAQEVFMLSPGSEPASVSKAFVYFVDDSNTLTHENVLQKGDFKPTKEEVPNLNVIKGTSWSALKVTCKEAGDYYLSLEPLACNIACLFQKKNGGQWTEEKQGHFLRRSEKEMLFNHMLFRINIQPGDTATLLLKIHDYVPITLILKTGTLQSFVSAFHYSNTFYCFTFGIILMMLLYNLYLFITQRESVYLHYVLYAFFSFLFTFETSGYATHLPYFFLQLLDFSPTFPPAFSSAFAMLFTLALFKGVLPKWVRICIYIFIGLLMTDVLLGCFGLKREAFLFIQPIALLLFFIHLTSGFIALKKGHGSARFYLLGFGSYAVLFTYFVLCTAGVLTRTVFSFQALNLGLTIEVIMLSFALGDKMKSFMLAKEKAQQETLDHVMENEKLVREQNIFLEQKVKERTAEVVQQKHLIEEKHKEITDSINYAERIQRSFLASRELLDQHLKEHFVLFRPKDVVSGDFYWAANLSNGQFALVTADSTGHGVPGAIMSILNISSLEHAVDKGLCGSSEILNQTRKTIIERLKKDGSPEGGKDGMDASLVCFDFTNKKISYSAANNPVLVVRENQLIELRPDKMPVGKHDKDNTPFSQYEFDLQSGDMIYTLTDGLPDQFGGPKGKKFMYKQLKELLMAIATESMPMQQQKLLNVFENWKGDQEQVDDVCVIGIRI